MSLQEYCTQPSASGHAQTFKESEKTEKNVSDFPSDDYFKTLQEATKLKIVLNRNNLDINEIKTCLEKETYFFDYETPLTRLVKNPNCTVDMVKLLLHHFHMSVNTKNRLSETPLIAAVKYGNIEVIKTLIEAGAHLNTKGNKKDSLLCMAFERENPKDVIQLLLNSGCPLKACVSHESLLHCAFHKPQNELKEDVLDFLLQKGAVDLKECVEDSSIMCYVLSRGATVDCIKLLLKKGAGLYDCKRHEFPMICLTAVEGDKPLQASVVQLLYDLGARLDVFHVQGRNLLSPLENALAKRNYEHSAIKLMLDLQVINYTARKKMTLLHFAVRNVNCLFETVKLLVNRGIPVNATDDNEDTALHTLVKRCGNIDIVRFLLERESSLSIVNAYGLTPIKLAMKCDNHCEILMALLSADTSLGLTDMSLLEIALYRSKQRDLVFRFVNLELCVKFAFLNNRHLDMNDFVDTEYTAAFKRRDVQLKETLDLMGSLFISKNRTLRDFAQSGYASENPEGIARRRELNKILSILEHNYFPFYGDILAERIGRPAMMKQIEDVKVFTIKKGTNQEIVLNSVCVFEIAKELRNSDLINFLTAFYTGNNPYQAEKDKFSDKREPKKAKKRPVKRRKRGRKGLRANRKTPSMRDDVAIVKNISVSRSTNHNVPRVHEVVDDVSFVEEVDDDVSILDSVSRSTNHNDPRVQEVDDDDVSVLDSVSRSTNHNDPIVHEVDDDDDDVSFLEEVRNID